MVRKVWSLLAVLSVLSLAQSTQAGEWGGWKWMHSYSKAYHDPANYPGRTVYPGSRYGFYGYARPADEYEPIPRSMLRTAPPTMYHRSKSLRHGAAPAATQDAGYDSGAGDYYAPADFPIQP